MNEHFQTRLVDIETKVKKVVADLLKDTANSLDLDASFSELGIDSVFAADFVQEVNRKLGIALGIEVIFIYRGIKELAEYILEQYGEERQLINPLDFGKEKQITCNNEGSNNCHQAVMTGKDADIAIIGISGKFAGSDTIQEFWEHLQAGDCCIEEINRKDWEERKYYDPDPNVANKSISKWGGLLKNNARFDTLFFNIAPREAERMDPQQRLFLEEAFKAFEDGGYSAEQLSGKKVGVFVGGRTGEYKEKNLLAEDINSQTFLGNDMAILAARIAYYLNLKGPSLTVNTACSSSLVAIHLACDSIRRGESKIALAGSVFVLSSPEYYVMASKTNMLSPDGRCKTFDNSANGIAIGEGVGAVVLKPLTAAIEDGNHIYGVIKGSVMNQDGRTKGITAPNMLSQKELIYETYKNAAVHPETVSYVEAHGTGTKLGDPIEVKALTEAFRMFTDKKQFCAIGSQKPNFGHTIMAAGIAGVFKILMALKYRMIPPTISLKEVNEHINFNDSPFYVNTTLQAWKSNDGGPLRAGVSAFGFSGTNCHLIIEEPPVQKSKANNQINPYYFFPFSAKTETALNKKIADMGKWIEKEAENYSIEDMSYTLLTGRSHFSVRCVLIAKNMDELKNKIIEISERETTEDYFRSEKHDFFSKETLIQELTKQGEGLIEELQEVRNLTGEIYKEKLLQLAALYVKGYNLNWENLFKRGKYYSIPMPAYPFGGEDYWLPQRVTDDGQGTVGIGMKDMEAHAVTEPVKEVRAEMDNRLQPVSFITGSELLQFFKKQIAGLLKIDESAINDNSPIAELGFDSILMLELRNKINAELKTDFSIQAFAENSDLKSIAAVLQSQLTQSVFQALPEIVNNPDNRFLPFPLNDVQQAYWVGRTNAFELGSIATHVYEEFESKNLDRVRLQNAINKLIQRHEMLRAIILGSGEQILLPEVPIYELQIIDLRGKTEEITKQKLQEIRDEMSHQVLPAHKWPLFEVRATIFNDDVVRLHISLDMLIVDLFSMSVLIRELILYYSKPELQLPPLELSFRDYVLAEKQLVETESYKRAKDFWLEQIDTLPAGPEIPYVKPLSSIQKAFFRRRQATLANTQWENVKSTAQKNALTPSVVLLTAYALVIASWVKNPRFTIDMTLFRRLPLHQQVNEIVGDFTSVVLMEMDFNSRCTFMAYAKQVQRKMYQNLDNTYFSGIEFLRELAARQKGKHRTLMPVVFTSGLGLDLYGGLNADELPRDVANILDSFSQNSYGVSQTSQVWLDQQVFEIKGELVFNWDVVDELFPDGMVDDMFQCYCGLLANLAEPEFGWNQEIHPVPPAQLEKRRQVNATAGPVSEKLLQDFLTEQVKLVPDKDAVITSNYTLSYAQMFKRSNQLARHLRALGASPNTLIAVVMEKGWEQIVAVYGILFAGAAYLPIDADVPIERLQYLLTTGECKIAVTQDKYAATLDWPAAIQTVSVTDSQLDLLDDSPLDNLQTPSDIAYVIFTSGSTGNPKGVVIDHRGAVNTILDINERFGVTGDDCALAISNLNFDLSVYDIFGLHGAGGSIVLPAAADAKDPARWLELLAANRITLWNSVPAIVQMLVEYAAGSGKKIPAVLRLIMMSGDWIPVNLPEQIWQQLPEAALYSLGGATEASIWSIHYPIKQINAEWTSIPYGTPLKNQSFLIYNEKLEPVPVWVPGQLYIGGIGLAKGYWKDEEKTKASFIIHPVTGERLYRTGDLGRYLPDGMIEFLGREDFQVKINGYRIELGEIEAALEKHETVKTVVVAALGDKTQKRLVGYIVPYDYDQAVNDKEAYYAGINAYLRTKLPDYMIPGAYVLLKELPLTANGKVDRQRLPEPDLSVDSDADRQIEPRTEVEKKIADIWKAELKLPEIGIHDNFFGIGGDSLTGVRINNRICQEFSVDISLATLFETQTIAALTLVIETILQQGGSNSTMAELPAIIDDPDNWYQVFPLTDLQQAYLLGRNTFFELGNVATHIYQEFEMKNVNIQKLNAALHTLIVRHDMLRAVIVNSSEQKILETVEPYVIEVYDFRKLDKKTREIRLREIHECMAHEMLPAGKWPLFDIRASVVTEDTTRLHVHLDMLIMDFTSVMTFFNEWMMLYQKPNVPLNDIAIHYRDYVLTERKIKDTTLYQKSRDYWLSKIDSLAPAPELPLKTNPQTIEKPRFRRKSSTLSPGQWNTLKERAKQQGITPSGIVFTAYAAIIAAWSKESRFTLNLTLANRLPLHPQIDEIIGDFTSVALVELDYSRPEKFLSWAQHVQKAMLETLDYPYFSGVEVIRELVTRRGGMREAIMPVVFTSGLGLNNEFPDLFARQKGEFSSLSETSQVWLDQQVFEIKSELVFNWDVVEELFPDGMIDDMFYCYCQLLANLAEPKFDWNQEIHPVPQAQLAQRRQVNATAEPVSGKLLQDFLAEQVKLVPDKDAVITANYKLSYAQLFKRSNQLARHLRALGASPNTLVAVVMEKGWEQIVAVYGILFAGAAYLPVDADVPPERLHYLLHTGECKLVVTQDKYKAALAWPAAMQIVSVTDSELDLLDDSPLDSVQTPADIAYVIFTSGSTGNPKGVVIDHRGAVNTILDINQRFGVTGDDCILAISNLNFDLSVYDIFGLHSAGGSIVLPGAADAKDPARWLDLLAANRITLWNSVPAIVQMLVEYAAGSGKKIPATLRLIMMSGDWIPVSLPEQIWQLLPEAALYSLGGATEASIWSIHYPIKQINAKWTSIPYGTPLKNQSFQIYNEKLERVPVWVPGQLYIGGIGLAIGYWKDEEKTKASFIIHPVTGERLYRTGDLGRYLTDGTIEFLGREDFQVKINGYRIELGEIEAALEKHETVKTVVVAALGDKTPKRLVGYIVPRDYDQAVNDKEAYYAGINAYLRTKLPDYMIPGAYVLLKDLPLTANGKVDRQRLPEPDFNNTDSTDYAAPTNEMEERLVKVWQSVLDIADIGIKDNFFNIGGNSLKVIQLLTEIKKEFNGQELSLQFLLKEPTIEKISKYLAMEATEGNKGKHSSQEDISFLKTPDTPSLGLFCFPNSSSYATGEMFASLASCLPDSIEVMAVNIPGHGNQKPLLPTIQEVVAQFIEFIAPKSDKPLYILGYSFGCLPAFELVRELEVRNCVVDGLIMLSSMAPDDFGKHYFPKISPAEMVQNLKLAGPAMAEMFENMSADDIVLNCTIVRNDLDAMMEYRYPEYKLHTPLYLFQGEADQYIESTQYLPNWEKYAQQVNYIVIPEAEHEFLEPHTQAVADRLLSIVFRKEVQNAKSLADLLKI